MSSKILEAYSHLGAALSQSIDTDDQIIMGHVRDAHFILDSLINDLRGLDRYNAKTILMDKPEWMYAVGDIEKILGLK